MCGFARQRHHRGDGGHGERAVCGAECEDNEFERPGRTVEAGKREAEQGRGRSDAAANGPHPQRAERPAERGAPGDGHDGHAEKHAAMLEARKLSRFPRRHAEDLSGEGLEDEILRTIGQHRHEDENGEAPCLGFVPHLAQRFAEGGFRGGFGRRRRARLRHSRQRQRQAEKPERRRCS